MEANSNSLLMTPVHRVMMIALIAVEHLVYLWAMLLFINYISYRIPFIDYPSIITAETT
jgi:hypothetical protein